MKLAIDTSTKKAVLALKDEDIFSSRVFEPRATQKVIFSELAAMLVPDTLTELDGIVVGLGPGSFTGVKIGVMAAKTLAWSRDIPIVGVGSMDAVAAGISADCDPKTSLIIAVPSTRGEAYIRIYELQDDTWSPSGDILDLPLEKDPIDSILPEGLLLISGEAAESLAEIIKGHRDFVIAMEDRRTPSAEGLFSLAESRFSSGNTDDPHSLVPDYIRLSQPEQKEKGDRS